MADPAYPPNEPPPVYEPPKEPQAGPPPQGYPPPGAPPQGPPPQGYPQAYPQQGYPQQPQPYPNQPPQPGYPMQTYPQQPGQPHYGMGHTTTIITPAVTAVVAPMKFGEAPVIMACPHCQSQVTTSISYKIGTFTWMVVGIMALIGLFFFPPLWLCCCIPCCIPACKDVDHHCPNCNKYLGHFSRMM